MTTTRRGLRSQGVLLITGVAFALTAQFAYAQNLIQNPGLETAGVAGVPANWVKTFWGTPTPTFTYPAAGHAGNGATVTFAANSNGDARWQHAAVAVEAGATYTFSAWYKSNIASEVDAEFTNASNAVSYAWVADVPSSANVWKQVTAQLTIPGGITKASIFQYIDRKGNLTIDDVSLTKNGGTPPPTTPTLSLSASPLSITQGQSSTVTWSSTNTTGCTASNGWTGAKGLSGTESVSPNATTTYVMTCAGASSNVSQQVVIGVKASSTPPTTPTPTLTFSTSPTTVNAGATSTLSWTSTNATSCSATNGWTGSKGVSGTQAVNPTATTTYALDCNGAGGTVHKEVIVGVRVTPPPATSTLTFTASPASINQGQSSTLSWSTTNVTSCTASGGWTGAKATTTTQVVSPTATTTYTLACSGSGGNVSKSATVNVIVPSTPPPTGQFTEGMVSLTFDDSWITQYTNALPILQTAALKGTFYLTTQPIQEVWDDFMTTAQVKDIANKGHEIAGHTVTHADLATLTKAKINTEIKNSKTYLQTLTGQTVVSLAYPYGSYNTTVKNLSKTAGYTTARGVDFETHNIATTDKYALLSQCIETTDTTASIKARIDSAKANKQWYILCFHEVKTGGDQYTTTPARLQEIVNYIKSSGIKVVTVKQGRALMAN